MAALAPAASAQTAAAVSAYINISGNQNVEVGQPIELTIGLRNARGVAGYETLLAYDSDNVHLRGLEQRTKGLRLRGRDVYTLGPINVEQGTFFGVATCPVEECGQRGRGKNNNTGARGNVQLATVTVVPHVAGPLNIALSDFKVVDGIGNLLPVTMAKGSLSINVAESVDPYVPFERDPETTLFPVARGGIVSALSKPTADLTLDGNVDGADITEAVFAWTSARELGAACGLSHQAHVDVTADGCVDVADIQRVASQYGTDPGTIGQTTSDQGAPEATLMQSGSSEYSVLSAVFAQVAPPGAWVVNSKADGDDATIGDGICATSLGVCTLRAAIREANARSGPDFIAFNISGTGPHVIQLSSTLPSISDFSGSLTIDGYTQPGSSVNTAERASNAQVRIEIRGTGITINAVDDMMRMSSGDNVIRGISMYNGRRGIWMSGPSASNNTIAGSFIGTNNADINIPTSSITGAFGIRLDQGSSNNLIGGTDLASRNVISANGSDGIMGSDEGTAGTRIFNNIIGLSAAGTKRMPNRQDGIDINFGVNNWQIGGLNPGERNVITGNAGDGIEISHDPATAQNVVQGNYFGVDLFGRVNPNFFHANDKYGVSLEDGVSNNIVGPGNILSNNGNSQNLANLNSGGIEIYGFNFIASGNVIQGNSIGVNVDGNPAPNQGYGIKMRFGTQGTTVGPDNIIAHNKLSGVYIMDNDSDFNTITRNSIHSNVGLGIDIEPDGVNQNGQYSNAGPNQRVHFPVIQTAEGTQVTGTACSGCTVEIFVADAGEGAYGEGKTFFGSADAETGGTFSVTAATPLTAGSYITATATDADGNTSEFSLNFLVGDDITPPPPGDRIALPGTIEVENYNEGGQNVGYFDTTSGNIGGAHRSDDVDIQATTDVGGGFNVGWTVAGEWLKYEVSVEDAGDYIFTFRVATTQSGKTFHLEVDGADVTGPISVPNTGGHQSWTDVQSDPIALTGNHTLRLVLDTGGYNLNSIDVTADAGTEPPPPPAGIALPGRVQAEDYNPGGQNVGYFDTTSGNIGGVYRFDDVDIQASTDTGGGFNVGWTITGEWLQYNVSVETADDYVFTVRLASPHSGKSFRLLVDGSDVTGPLAVPNSGGWQAWRDVTTGPIALTAGNHTLRLAMETGDFNFNYIDVALAEDGGTEPPPPPTGVALPGTIQAEDYNPGGQNVGYFDTTSGNIGGAYRSDDVDLQACVDTSGCGFNVGWTAAGEWLKYDVSVETAGTYTVSVRIATASSGKSVAVELNDAPWSGTLTLPHTGGYQNWQTVTSGPLELAAGTHTLKLTTATGGFNLNFISVQTAVSEPPPPSGETVRIEAEDYNPGGQNVGYFDTTSGNIGGQYRSDDVDIQASNDTGGGFNVGWTVTGEWLEYDVSVAETGTYTFKLRVATPHGGKSVSLQIDGRQWSLAVPTTGGWQAWTDIAQGVELEAGTYTLRVVMDSGDFNFNYIDITLN